MILAAHFRVCFVSKAKVTRTIESGQNVVKLTTKRLPVLRLRMRGAVPPLIIILKGVGLSHGDVT